MVRLLIIADDFTGALDTGVQFAFCGANLQVITDPDADLRQAPPCEVLVLDAETRHLTPVDAYRAVARIVAQAVALGIPYLYKKTDSALRGNVGAELTALLEASGNRQLPFLPAFPQIDRITQAGRHYIHGTPVAQSVFGRDPFEPVHHSSVSELIATQSDVPVHIHPPLSSPSPPPEEDGILVFDAARVEDLERTGRLLLEAGKLRIMAGCAGFGAVIPALLGLGSGRPEPLPALDPRLLVICGSVNPITTAQLDHAERDGFLRVRLSPEQKLDVNHWLTEQGGKEFDVLQGILEEYPYRIIDTNDAGGNSVTAEYALQRGLTPTDIRLRIANSVGYLVSRIFSCPSVGTLLITGGDTLLQCMDYMGVHELRPLWELDAGVVLSAFSYGGYTRHVITKSGGFGDVGLLNKVAQKLIDMQKGTVTCSIRNCPA